MKKLHKLAKEINELLLADKTIQEYLELKKSIDNDESLTNLRNELDILRKEICKNEGMDSEEYYNLLQRYNEDSRIKRFNSLKKEIQEYFLEISDILSLK